jgi:hypothetical protein
MMSETPCRDCGYLLKQNARGCPRCARNIEAERMIERFILMLLLPCAVILLLIVTVLILWVR